jgi:MutS2 family protein
MDPRVLSILEYDLIKAQLQSFAASGLGKKAIEMMKPEGTKVQIELRLTETTEARRLIDAGAQIPLYGLSDITESVERASAGGILTVSELVRVADFLRSGRILKQYLKSKQQTVPLLSRYAEGIELMGSLQEELEEALQDGIVSSQASPHLGKLRAQIKTVEERIQSKITSLLASPGLRESLQESYISVKDGRYVLPVKTSCRHKVDGYQVSSSSSGATVFVEPAAIRKLADQLQVLQREEEAEVYQILSRLAGAVAAGERELRINLEWLAIFDFIVARGKMSAYMNARPVPINTQNRIRIKGGRHPLLGDNAVPLDLAIARPYGVLVITGPNTGGKTVVLKTVGLLTAMVQSGLHIPVEEDTEMAVFSQILADIGDGQSIQQSLSTFSSHMKNIAEILSKAGESTLVLIDEIGTGTDPAEGAALACAILRYLYKTGGVTAASTHYGDVKVLADMHPGFLNGSMTFDRESLKPLYQLQMGVAGQSNGLWIAGKWGIPAAIVGEAKKQLLARPVSDDATGSFTPFPEIAKEDLLPIPADEPASVAETVQPIPLDPVEAAVEPFEPGDMVIITATQEKGRVMAAPDGKGNLVLEVKGKRIRINHQRVHLYLKGKDLYPDGYDLKVVLLDKEDRRLDRLMGRKLTDQVRIIRDDLDQWDDK